MVGGGIVLVIGLLSIAGGVQVLDFFHNDPTGQELKSFSDNTLNMTTDIGEGFVEGVRLEQEIMAEPLNAVKVNGKSH